MGYEEVKFESGRQLTIDRLLRQKLDNIKMIIKKNWDAIIVIDGMERSGKSTLGFACADYMADGNLTLNNVAVDGDDAMKKCESLPNGSVLMVDEGSLVFSSKDSMTKEQKKLLKIINVIGQKNMVFIIVLPSFFELTKAIAVHRSLFLLHVYTDKKLNRGRFTYFGQKGKKVLYDYGKKHFGSYAYPRANWIGKFKDYDIFGEEYKELKRKSLFSALHAGEEGQPLESNVSKTIGIERVRMYKRLKELGWTQARIAEVMGVSVQIVGKYSRNAKKETPIAAI
ncbi:MAG: hypothetical protein KKC77_19075 [Proteobacteria bacterium]|nr:hypothetical protein [Pseudomonadota bacterium]